MATTYMNFDGYAHWAKVYEDHYDEYMGNKRWSIFLEFKDENELGKFKNSGLRLQLKDTPGAGVQFRRPFQKLIKGEVVTFDPPEVNQWDDESKSFVPFTAPIGNGSLVRVNVAVYDTAKGKGHRLQSVSVMKHVPYEPKATEEDPKSVKTNVSPKVEKPW